MNNKGQYTTQKEIRASFTERAIEAGLNLRRVNGQYHCDTRCAFVDYVDCLARSEMITEELAKRATL